MVVAESSQRLAEVEVLGKIVSRMSSSRLVKHVYSVSRARYEAGKSSKWCKYTHELLKELGMNDVWQQGTITCNMTTWDKELREKIHAREEKEWLARMQTKPKLRAYRTTNTNSNLNLISTMAIHLHEKH